MTFLTTKQIVSVLREHMPRDRFNDDTDSHETYCTCGGWEGDYFADGEAGPFDDHLAEQLAGFMTAPTTQQIATVLERVREAHKFDVMQSDLWECIECGAKAIIERDDEGQPFYNPFIRHQSEAAAEQLAALWPEPETSEVEWGLRDDWYDDPEPISYGTSADWSDAETYARLDAERLGLTLVARTVTPWQPVPDDTDGGE